MGFYVLIALILVMTVFALRGGVGDQRTVADEVDDLVGKLAKERLPAAVGRAEAMDCRVARGEVHDRRADQAVPGGDLAPLLVEAGQADGAGAVRTLVRRLEVDRDVFHHSASKRAWKTVPLTLMWYSSSHEGMKQHSPSPSSIWSPAVPTLALPCVHRAKEGLFSLMS